MNCACLNEGLARSAVVLPAPVPPAVISTTRGFPGSGFLSASSKRKSDSAAAAFCVALLHLIRASFEAAYSGETISRALSVPISLPNFRPYSSASSGAFCHTRSLARCSSAASSGVKGTPPLLIAHLRFRAEDVAFAAAGVDQPGRASGLEFGAQALDVDIDHVGEGAEALVPDVLRDGFAAYDAVLVEQQEFKQGVFLGGHADGAAGAGDGVAGGVQSEVGRLDHQRARHAGAARKGAQAGQQFLEVEGLHQVIVGAGIEPGHA